MRKVHLIVSLLVVGMISAAFMRTDEPKRSKGLDLSGMDLMVSPREDFFLYANGTWLKKTEIPASETSWGSFNILRGDNQKNIKNILEEAAKSKSPAGSVQQRVGDFFVSGMDTLTIEKRGYIPIKPTLTEIDKIKDYKGLLEYSAKHPLEGGNTFVGIGISIDAKNPDAYVVSLRQAGTGLPEKDYYTKMDESTVKIRTAYKKYIATLFTLTGTEPTKAAQLAEDILALETLIATSHMGRIEMRNPNALYNKFSVKDFSAKVPNLDLENMIITLRMKTDSIIVAQTKYYESLNELLPKTSIETLKAKMKFSVISGAANLLSK